MGKAGSNFRFMFDSIDCGSSSQIMHFEGRTLFCESISPLICANRYYFLRVFDY